MIDENAFGLWIGYYSVEDDEYGLERDPFVARFEGFRALVRSHATERPPGVGVAALDMGHGVYFEVAEGDESESPIAWLKGLRKRLSEADFLSVGVLSHGSRWFDASSACPQGPDAAGTTTWWMLSHPSEALRKALYADAASRPDDDDDTVGWGPGLYLDTEAVEALGKAPKNSPTVLSASGARYYRAGS